ncbi:MAG: hypothetical protein ACK4Q4_06040 [Rhodocyclaceae bacterium]
MGGRDDITWDELKKMIFSLAEQGKETDRRMQETDRRMQETDQLIRELRESGKETDRRMQETDQRIRQLEIQIGRLGNRLGDFVEGFVEPAVVRLFRARGLPVHHVLRRIEAIDDDGRLLSEIDLLVIDSDTAVAVECKSHAGVADVREHLTRLADFKRHFPRYADLKLQGALAAMHWSREAQRFAYRQGLWVLAQNGEAVEVKNDAAFQPRVW